MQTFVFAYIYYKKNLPNNTKNIRQNIIITISDYGIYYKPISATKKLCWNFDYKRAHLNTLITLKFRAKHQFSGDLIPGFVNMCGKID